MAAYEGMLAETVLFQGHDGDQISGYMARPLGAGPYPVSSSSTRYSDWSLTSRSSRER